MKDEPEKKYVTQRMARYELAEESLCCLRAPLIPKGNPPVDSEIILETGY